MKKEVTLISKKRQGSKELAGGEAPRRAWQGKAALGPACHIFWVQSHWTQGQGLYRPSLHSATIWNLLVVLYASISDYVEEQWLSANSSFQIFRRLQIMGRSSRSYFVLQCVQFRVQDNLLKSEDFLSSRTPSGNPEHLYIWSELKSPYIDFS